MTSGLPQTRPGAVTQPDQGLIERIRRLEEQVEELSRRDMNRATVGQGGTFRGYFDNGQLAFTFGEDVSDGVRKVRMNWPSTGDPAFQIGPGNPAANEDEQFRLVDQAGNKVFATDGLAGYGLAEPSLSYMMSPVDAFARTSGVEDFAAECNAFFYNPGVWSRIRITNLSGITGGTARLVAIDGNGITQVSSTSVAFGAGISLATRIILLPEAMINAQNCKLQWKITPTGSGSLQCWPLMCKGTSKFFYDIDVSEH
jgi:hypothetical protein